MTNKSWCFFPDENEVKVYISGKQKAARSRDTEDFGKVVSIKKCNQEADMMVIEFLFKFL